ncbi:proline racemase family protein [Mesorhizobium sp. Cs1299R1N1]|uniref:proline racemase family protein n=1 Tax=Mesorhizobium sp. Cs1299R1N1 TaxID=3015172 RepID=UPI00301C0ED6
MKWSKMITAIGAHAEGEIGRVITGGIAPVPGNDMRERLLWLNDHGDHIRKFALYEPRGAAQMSVNLLLPPTHPGADIAFIPMQGDRSHAMSGSNAMCVVTSVLETGMFAMSEPETVIRLDTAAGLVTARASCRDGKVTSVSLDFVESFAEHLDHPLRVEGIGELKVDVAFGGVYYVLADAAALGLEIVPANARKLVDLGSRLVAAAKEQISVQHPLVNEFNSIAFCMFTSVEDREWQVYRNATILPPGRVDRSPCGTGSAARLSVMRARGAINLNQEVTMRSIIGSRFSVKVTQDRKIGHRKGIQPVISGRSWIYAVEQMGVDPSDPFQQGFTLADTWGEGIEHILPTN